jgi:signal transduction histidine kinase/heme-degrading monooxygenase HmoA
MILAVSRFRVRNAMEPAVADAFRQRPHLVDDAPGFLGLEVFTDARDPALFYLVTRWTDEPSFRAWHGSDEHRLSHAWIPKGLKLDPAFTQVTILKRLPRPAPTPDELAADLAPLLGDFLATSETLHCLVASVDGTLVYLNRAARQQLGAPEGQALGRSLWDVLTESAAALLRERVAAGERRPGERVRLNFVSSDHHPYTLECVVDVQPTGVVVLGEPSGPQLAALQAEMLQLNNQLAVAARESARKGRQLEQARSSLAAGNQELDARVQERTQELIRSNRDLEQFAYVASHDLQEPLRMVVSYLQLLERRYAGKLDSDADEFIGYAVDGARRMQRLINDLLAYSRVGRAGAQLRQVDVSAVVDRAVRALTAAIEEAGAVVTREHLPAVWADEGQLAQLFQNLIANAIKFRGEQPPRIHVSAETSEREVVFAVRDNGIGIAPEYRERIFVIFQRLHGRGEYPGTGIGLALCKKIAEWHGGRIWVESEVGSGSTFYVALPQSPTPTGSPAGPHAGSGYQERAAHGGTRPGAATD